MLASGFRCARYFVLFFEDRSEVVMTLWPNKVAAGGRGALQFPLLSTFGHLQPHRGERVARQTPGYRAKKYPFIRHHAGLRAVATAKEEPSARSLGEGGKDGGLKESRPFRTRHPDTQNTLDHDRAWNNQGRRSQAYWASAVPLLRATP